MDITAIITEYNPFHNGHKYQLDEIRRRYPETKIATIMSPSFVQRGAPAVFDKYTRGKCAVLSGADLALSMPVCFSVLSAQGFAEAGVRLAKKIGATALAFGVEDDDIELIEKIAQITLSCEFETAINEEVSEAPHLSYPTLREKALSRFLNKKELSIIKKPNNILAIEYVRAKNIFFKELEIRPIKRVGNEHLDTKASGEFLSALSIREEMRKGAVPFDFIPSKIHQTIKSALPLDFEKYEFLLSATASMKSYEDILFSAQNKEISDIIFASSRASSDYSEFRGALSRKKHNETKIDRILTGLMLGVGFDEFLHKEPKFFTLLALSSDGRKIVSSLRRKDDIHLISKGSDLKHKFSDSELKKQVDLELLADRIYAKCLLKPMGEGYFINQKPLVYEKEN